MRKGFITAAVIAAVVLIFVQQFAGEIDKQEKAVQFARNLTVERLESQMPEMFVMDYELGSFQITEKAKNYCTVEGEYQVLYGSSPENPFLEITVSEQFILRKKLLGPFKNNKLRVCEIVESNIRSLDDEWITSPEESRYVPFMSKDEAEQLEGISKISRKLLTDFILQTASEEQSTYMFYTGELEGGDSYALDLWPGDEAVLSCRVVEGGYRGTYIGYIEGLGYSCPVTLNGPDDLKWQSLMQRPFYLVEKTDGYYLYTEKHFEEVYSR